MTNLANFRLCSSIPVSENHEYVNIAFRPGIAASFGPVDNDLLDHIWEIIG